MKTRALRPHEAIIEGPPGSGKSAALNAAVAMARSLDARVAVAHCDVADSATPFGVVQQCFDSLFTGGDRSCSRS